MTAKAETGAMQLPAKEHGGQLALPAAGEWRKEPPLQVPERARPCRRPHLGLLVSKLLENTFLWFEAPTLQDFAAAALGNDPPTPIQCQRPISVPLPCRPAFYPTAGSSLLLPPLL